MQQFIFSGRLGRDAKVVTNPDGSQFLSMAVGVDDSYKDQKTGQLVERTDWYEVTYENVKIADHLTKGSYIFIMAKKPIPDQYEKDGYVHPKIRVRALRIEFVKKEATNSGTAEPSGRAMAGQMAPRQSAPVAAPSVPAVVPTQQNLGSFGTVDEDLPF